jgi:hypothetical protein
MSDFPLFIAIALAEVGGGFDGKATLASALSVQIVLQFFNLQSHIG